MVCSGLDWRRVEGGAVTIAALTTALEASAPPGGVPAP